MDLLTSWQSVRNHYMEEFSVSEQWKIPHLSAVPNDKDVDIPLFPLSERSYELLAELFKQPIPIRKIPESPSHFAIVIEKMDGPEPFVFFRRLENHPNWYVVDLFLKDKRQFTCLALDIEPVEELKNPATDEQLIVCDILKKNLLLSDNEVYQLFKLAYNFIQVALLYMQE